MERHSSESEVEQKTARLQFWKYNKIRNWDNVFFTDESSFYLISPGINKLILKNFNNYDEQNIRKRFMYGTHSDVKEE